MKTPSRKPAHKKLQILIGTWNTTGDIEATEATPATTLTATDTYAWLPGGFFVLHTVDARMGSTVARSIEIIGYDAESGAYTTRSYDDQGGSADFTAALKGRKWTITGEAARFSGSFNDAENVLAGSWERKNAKGQWVSWMAIKLEKTLP